MTYIYQLDGWPHFTWDAPSLAPALTALRLRQGRLLGRMESLGFSLQKEATLESMTLEVVKTSEIEGDVLAEDQVRSSIARRLGMDIAGLVPSDRRVDGVVDMLLDATGKFERPLTVERLFRWHAALFPGRTDLKVGAWRDDARGPMRVVSGQIGAEKVHYEAPPAERLDAEMKAFLDWENGQDSLDPVLKAAIAHLWFVTLHPFDDGNGRIARALADRALARSENSGQRFYSMSAQIRLERKAYYDVLELTQKDTLDITDWLRWFLGCLDRAFAGADSAMATVLLKERFWKEHAGASFNARQRLMLNRLIDGFEGKLTTMKWAKLAKCSHDTALRDISDLIGRGILAQDAAGGRSTSYSLKPVGPQSSDKPPRV
ncbi:MAG: cell filamentation protein Fic [Elusimicrobia bacterium RBG_16_66_12]|nr:MAG: cell filamentation protein Fic [Elusimicrobia bacterium RBG_16_66_12]